MLAEENAFEARRLSAGPEIEIVVEIALRRDGIEMVVEVMRRVKKFKNPRLL